MKTKEPKITKNQLIDLNSKWSSMRWAFYETVVNTIRLTFIALSAYVIAQFLNGIFGFHIVIDLGTCALLIGVVAGLMTTGKAVQSFAEGKYPTLMQSNETPNLSVNIGNNFSNSLQQQNLNRVPTSSSDIGN